MPSKYGRILLTGATGDLGTYLRPLLRGRCGALRVSDIASIDSDGENANDEVEICALEDFEAIKRLMKDVDAVIHMGASSSYDTSNSMSDLLDPNIVGVYNIYEAARLCGVKRVVYASSHHVVGRYRQSVSVGVDAKPRPDSLYAVAKLFGENLAQLYFDRYGVESVCLRIGSCFPEPTDVRMLASWFSYADLWRAIDASLAAGCVDCSVLYGVSNNKRLLWLNDDAKHLGYQPQDCAEDWRERIEASDEPVDPDLETWHGGTFGN